MAMDSHKDVFAPVAMPPDECAAKPETAYPVTACDQLLQTGPGAAIPANTQNTTFDTQLVAFNPKARIVGFSTIRREGPTTIRTISYCLCLSYDVLAIKFRGKNLILIVK